MNREPAVTAQAIVHKPLTFGSLFAGVGGFDLGFERAGLICKWQVEIDDYANRVLAKHWPHVRRWPDVRTWPQADTPAVEVIAAGFPCQDISYAGKGAGLEGERSGLFFEVIRVVRELRPRCVVLENVAALLNRGLDRVLGELAEIGFDAEWHCIPAAAVGAPHIRDRIFVLAYARHGTLADGTWGPRSEQQPKTPKRKQLGRDGEARQLADAKSADDWCRQRWPIAGQGTELGEGGFGGRGPWATEPAVGRVADGVPNRVDRLRCLGNAIVPQVGELVGKRLMLVL